MSEDALLDRLNSVHRQAKQKVMAPRPPPFRLLIAFAGPLMGSTTGAGASVASDYLAAGTRP